MRGSPTPLFDEAEFRREVGERVRRARTAAKLTQLAVADDVGVDKSAVSRWEHAKGSPSLMQLVQLALRCKTRPETLIEGIVRPTFEQLTLDLENDAKGALYTLADLLKRRRE